MRRNIPKEWEKRTKTKKLSMNSFDFFFRIMETAPNILHLMCKTWIIFLILINRIVSVSFIFRLVWISWKHIAGVDVIFVWNQARTLVDTHRVYMCAREMEMKIKFQNLMLRKLSYAYMFASMAKRFFLCCCCFLLHKSKEDRKSKHILLLN